MAKPGKKPFISKVCPACGIEKLREEYYKKGETVSYKCKPCTKLELVERAPKYFGKYAEYQNEWRRTQSATNPEYVSRRQSQKKARYDVKKDELNAQRRADWANNPHCSARKYYRRKDVKDRTPKWVDLNEVLEIYANCPKGMVVDHIIPLRGVIDGHIQVTGLHVPCNLQYLSKEENSKKYNKITQDYLDTIVVKR